MQLFSAIVEFNVFIQVIQLQYEICSDVFVLSWGLLVFLLCFLFYLVPYIASSHTLFLNRFISIKAVSLIKF